MPVNLNTGNVIEIKHHYTSNLDSSVSMNVLHYSVRSVVVTATGLPPAVAVPFGDVVADIGESAYTTWAAVWKVVVSNMVALTHTTAQQVWVEPRSVLYDHRPGAATIGMVDSENLPMQDAVTILKQTEYGERWGVGRLFLSGIPESQAEGGFITGDLAGDMAAVAAYVRSSLLVVAGTLTITLVPVLFAQTGALTARINDVVASKLSDDTIKTQRRRRPGKGM